MSDLQFNISQLLKSEVGATRTYEFHSHEPLDLEGATAHDIEGSVKFILTNFGVIARGHARAILDLTCARCLEPFSAPTEIDFEEEYRPVIDIVTGQPSAPLESDTAFFISENHSIDLTEALRQDLLLTVEIVPVCRPDCRGLCPTCGVNLNTETCNCSQVDDENPFAALQSLLGGVHNEAQ